MDKDEPDNPSLTEIKTIVMKTKIEWRFSLILGVDQRNKQIFLVYVVSLFKLFSIFYGCLGINRAV